MKKYKTDLKKTRELKADKILKDFIDKHGLRKSLLTELTLLQNRTRGSIFELMGEVSVTTVFNIDHPETQKVFNTPFGKRKVDLYFEADGVIVEIKSGYARSRSFIRKQIQKDAFIVNDDHHIKRAVWILFRGATKPLITYLEKNKIEYIDMKYDMIDSGNNNDDKKIIIEA